MTDSDDTFASFVNRYRDKGEPAPTTKPALPPTLTQHEADGREAYEAFDNQVQARNVEIRCHGTGQSLSIPYAHIGGILFDFLTGRKLTFTGAGFGVIIEGQNLREILRALNLHCCGFIQDYSPVHHINPKPPDTDKAFVERIAINPLRPQPQAPSEDKAKTDKTGAETKPEKA